MNTRPFGHSPRSAKWADHQWHARGQGFKSPQLHDTKSPVLLAGDFAVSAVDRTLWIGPGSAGVRAGAERRRGLLSVAAYEQVSVGRRCGSRGVRVAGGAARVFSGGDEESDVRAAEIVAAYDPATGRRGCAHGLHQATRPLVQHRGRSHSLLPRATSGAGGVHGQDHRRRRCAVRIQVRTSMR
jgi:hypothetical protein